MQGIPARRPGKIFTAGTLTVFAFLIIIASFADRGGRAAAQTAQQLVTLAVSDVRYDPVSGTDSVILAIKTLEPSNILVEYGSSAGSCADTDFSSISSSTNLNRHELFLTGLNAGASSSAVICYRVKDADTGTLLAESSFRTARRPGEPFSFGVAGDVMPWNPQTTATSAGWQIIAGQMHAEKLDLALLPGDIIHNYWNESIASRVEEKYNGFLGASMNFTASAPLYSAVGNHEQVYIPVCRAAYEREFTLPQNTPSANGYGEHYYSFDSGDTHFVSLSTEIPGQEGLIIGEQLAWLEQDLAASTKLWTVVFFHRPLFYPPEVTIQMAAYERWFDPADPVGPANRQQLHQLFKTSGVDLVFEGHAHWLYHHIEEGVSYVIAGGGGSYIPPYPDPLLGEGDLFFAQSYGHVKLDESPEKMVLSMIDIDGGRRELFRLYPDQTFDLNVDSGEPPVISGISPADVITGSKTTVTANFMDPPLSSGIDISSVSLSVSGGTVSGCFVNESGVSCTASELATGEHEISVSVSDEAGNTALATGSLIVEACQQYRPALDLMIDSVYWASYADFQAGNLSIDLKVSNQQPEPGVAVEIGGATATNGAICITGFPLVMGTISSGNASPFTLVYAMPQGVQRFRSTIMTSAFDACGNRYDYPDGYQGS